MKLRHVLLVALLLLLPRPAFGVIVLILSSGNSAIDDSAQAAFRSAGHSATIGPQYTAFTGSGLAGVGAVLFLANANWNQGDMPLAGQTALVNFVSTGGGLITGEWVNWKAGTGSLTTLKPILPVAVSSQWTGGSSITYTQTVFDPVLSAGLPSAFTFVGDSFAGVESVFGAKSGATIYYASSGGADRAGVVGWYYGAGRVLQISTTIGQGQLGTVTYARLLGNAASFVAVPEPSTWALLAAGLLLIGVRWLRSGRRRVKAE